MLTLFLRSTFFLFFFFFILMNGVVFTQNAPKSSDSSNNSGENSELARIIILPIENRTGSENYKYLSGSLSDAIGNSMQKNFTFIKITQDKVLKAQKDIDRADSKEEKRDNSKEKDENEKYLNKIRKLSNVLDADIVIFGDYELDKAKNDVIFHIYFFLGAADIFKSLHTMRYKLDNRIFQATDEVAETITDVIKLLTQMDQTLAQAYDRQGEGQDKKIILTRVSQEKPQKKPKKMKQGMEEIANLSWDQKKFFFGFSPGFFINLPPANRSSNSTGCIACSMQLSAIAKFWIANRWYLGAKLGFEEIWTATKSFGTIYSLDGFALIGYGISLKRWLFSVDLGAGYFVISDASVGSVYNPSFSVRVGADVKMASAVSLGISANVYTYYDQPTPLSFAGIAVSLNYILW